jgi:uncharacterized membrane protein
MKEYLIQEINIYGKIILNIMLNSKKKLVNKLILKDLNYMSKNISIKLWIHRNYSFITICNLVTILATRKPFTTISKGDVNMNNRILSSTFQ